ncbi:unnamed protein product [Diplocarpon coronariae]
MGTFVSPAIVRQQRSTTSWSHLNISSDDFPNGRTVLGNWIADNVEIGGSVLKEVQMGVMRTCKVGTSDHMIKKATIKYKAFSLELDNDEAKTGSLLFGGISFDKSTAR